MIGTSSTKEITNNNKNALNSPVSQRSLMLQLPVGGHQTQETCQSFFLRRCSCALLGEALDCGNHIGAFSQRARVE